MILLGIGTLEGALFGLGLGLIIDTLINWGSSNVAFVLLLFVAGTTAGALIGYFFIGNTYEEPWLVLAAQGVTAVLAAILGTAIFVLAHQPVIGRILLLFMIWGSFPGAVIGFYMALTRRAPASSDLRRNDPMPMPQQFGLPAVGVNALPMASAAAVAGTTPAVSQYGRPLTRPDPSTAPVQAASGLRSAVEERSALLANQLEQEAAALQPRLGVRAKVVPLDSGEACVTVNLSDPHGSPHILYLTCPPNYPMVGPKLTLSRVDLLTGQEMQISYEARAIQFWHPRRSLEDVVSEVQSALAGVGPSAGA